MRHLKNYALSILFGVAVVGVAVSSVQAAVVQSFGAGSAVTSVDLSTNFDTIVDGQNLSAFSDGGLNVTRAGNAACNGTACSAHPPFVGMSGGIHYTGGSGPVLSISTSDASKITGLEFNIGTGFGASNFTTNLNGYWEIFTGGIKIASSSFTLPGFPTVIGFFDAAGFDELRIGMSIGSTLAAAFDFQNAVAIDNLSAQLAVTAIPLPAALPIFLTGLVGLGLLRRRQRNS